MVADVVMPPIGLIVGGLDFSLLAITLKEAVGEAPAVTLGYGKFIQTLVDFTLVALAVFFLIKGINSLKRKKEEAPKPPAAPPVQEVLLTEIRDLLKNRT